MAYIYEPVVYYWDVYGNGRNTFYLFSILADMKKFLKTFALFSLICFVFYVCMLCLWGEYLPQKYKPNLNYRKGSYGQMYTRISDLKKYKNVDILFLGSSRAYRVFDTRIYAKQGYYSFNLGSSSQTPIQTKLLMKRYLKQLNPKLIVYAVDPNAFASDGVESAMDIIANDKNDRESLKMLAKINHLKVFNTLIYGYYKDYIHKDKFFSESKYRNTDTYIDGGYVEKKMSYFKHISHPQEAFPLRKKQINSFEEVLTMFKQENIPFLLVQTLVTPSAYAAITTNDTFDNTMKAYGTYLNFNESLHLDDSLYFFDALHMNQQGVLRFNEKIVHWLDSLEQ